MAGDSEPTVLSMIVDSLGELKGTVKDEFRDVKALLSEKADKADVERLRQDHDARLHMLEHASSRTWKIIAGTLTVLASVVIAAATVIQLLS